LATIEPAGRGRAGKRFDHRLPALPLYPTIETQLSMRIGITYDLKADEPAGADLPDDHQEEFDSPVTLEAIAHELRDLGHEVIHLGDGRELLQKLLESPPEFVFNFAEGQGVGRCREARVPAVLELLGIPYTGSDPLTLAATLDKDCAKRLVQSAGIRIPRGVTVAGGASFDLASLAQELERDQCPFPVICKPAWEGSSKGIRSKCVVDRPERLPEVIDSLSQDHRQPVLIEEYIQGDELTVGMVGNDPPQFIGVMRVLPVQPTDRFVYSLEVKRDYLRQVRYECPAAIGKAMQAVQKASLAAYEVLGCRDVARIDFRLRDGVPYFLEVNPLPGLNPSSGDLVIMAKLAGWDYARLIRTILQAALDRQRGLDT
jgi:D-alanine-D-alanine ligase